MGMQTEIVINNDYFHEIEKDPQRFVDQISFEMNDRTLKHPNRFSGVEVHPSHHRDEALVLLASDYGLEDFHVYGEIGRSGRPRSTYEQLLAIDRLINKHGQATQLLSDIGVYLLHRKNELQKQWAIESKEALQHG